MIIGFILRSNFLVLVLPFKVTGITNGKERELVFCSEESF